MVSKAILISHNKFIRKLNLYKFTFFINYWFWYKITGNSILILKKKWPQNPITCSPNYAHISVESRMILNSNNVFSEMPHQPVMNRVRTRFVRILIYSPFIHCLPQKTQENVALPACCHIMSGSDLITWKTPGSVAHSSGSHLPSLAALNQC